jgi:hypothetical protein
VVKLDSSLLVVGRLIQIVEFPMATTKMVIGSALSIAVHSESLLKHYQQQFITFRVNTFKNHYQRRFLNGTADDTCLNFQQRF